MKTFMGHSKVILIVDDEEDILELLSVILCDEGHQVLTASNGVEALGILAKEKIDLVITDIRMPQMNGIDLLAEIKNRGRKHPPVVFISGYSDISEEDAYALGVARFIFKPFEVKTILQAVRELTAPLATENTASI
jgi:CheY-like chemotaxis protein